MKRDFLKLLTAVLIIVFAVLIITPQVTSAAYTVKQYWVRTALTAGETLTIGQLVAIKDADGLVYKADANDATVRPAIGVVSKGATSGNLVGITIIGKISGWSALSEGAAVYLSETAGAATQSSPTYSQQVGVALTTTTYFFNFSAYLDTTAVVALGVLAGATPIILEGATADDYETTVTITDPTADRTFTIPDLTGTVGLILGTGAKVALPSTLTTNGVDVANSVWGGTNQIIGEGATADDYEHVQTYVDPTTDNTVTWPDYSGAVPLVIAQGYTQTSHSEASATDVTGSSLTLADGWFTEGKTIRYTLTGTVTGTNGLITINLYFEDGAVMQLASADAAAGDFRAVFEIVATASNAQRISGWLIAEAGAETIVDYATDNTDTGAAGTIPIKLQIELAHADDVINAEMVKIEFWNKAD